MPLICVHVVELNTQDRSRHSYKWCNVSQFDQLTLAKSIGDFYQMVGARESGCVLDSRVACDVSGSERARYKGAWGAEVTQRNTLFLVHTLSCRHRTFLAADESRQLGLSYTAMYNVYSSLSSAVPLYSPHHSTMTACTEHDVSRLKSNSAWWRLGPDFRWDRESNTVFDCLTNRPDAVLQLMHTNADAAVYVWVFIYTSLFRQVAANR